VKKLEVKAAVIMLSTLWYQLKQGESGDTAGRWPTTQC